MKVIIAGSRGFTDLDTAVRLVGEAVAESGFDVIEVVSGGARGIDDAGKVWACEQGRTLTMFAAGPIRNREMAEYAEALIAIHDGESRGTANMIEEATRRGLKVYVKTVRSAA